jgi:hypothetical protein
LSRADSARSGEGGIRTPVEKPAKTPLFTEEGAKSGALAIIDPELATVVDAWPTLPEAVRAGMLAMVRATRP